MPADRISVIEQHIRRLENELQSLKRELGATCQQLRQSRQQAETVKAQAQQIASQTTPQTSAPPAPAPEPKPKAVQTRSNRFGIESADGRNSIYLTGRLHLDVADYLNYQPASKFASVQNLNSGANARRARLGITGKFAEDWAYTLVYDFGGSSDGFPPLSGAPDSAIENAYITYNGLNKGSLSLAFDLGYMDTPFSLESATGSNNSMFLERASIHTVATGIFANDFRSAFGVRSNDERYWMGIYLTGPESQQAALGHLRRGRCGVRGSTADIATAFGAVTNEQAMGAARGSRTDHRHQAALGAAVAPSAMRMW